MITKSQWDMFCTYVRFARRRFTLRINGNRVLHTRRDEAKMETVIVCEGEEKDSPFAFDGPAPLRPKKIREHIVYSFKDSVHEQMQLHDLYRRVTVEGVTLENFRNGNIP